MQTWLHRQRLPVRDGPQALQQVGVGPQRRDLRLPERRGWPILSVRVPQPFLRHVPGVRNGGRHVQWRQVHADDEHRV